jgi:hypothetical protein
MDHEKVDYYDNNRIYMHQYPNFVEYQADAC